MANVLLDLLRQLAIGAVADEARATPQGKSVQDEYVKPVVTSLLDAIVPPAAASDASAIPQGQALPNVPVGNPVLPDDKLIPADAVMTPEQEQMVMNRIATEAPERPRQVGRTYLPDIQMEAPVSPDRMNELDALIRKEDTNDFVRSFGPKIATRAQKLMSEAPEGSDPKGAAALASIEALAANADKAMDNEPMDLGAPVVGPKDVAMGQFPASMTQFSQTATPPQETKQAGFFDSAGKFFSDLFGDEERMTRLALAFNSMRYQPDQGLASVLGKRLETLQANKRDNKTAVVVAKRLTEMGYPQYAKIVMERPDMATEVLKQIMQKELEPESAIKTSAVQTDPATGQQYVVKTDPNTGTVERMNIEGAIGMTPQAKADLEASTASTTLDLKTAQEYGQKVFDQAQSINGQIGRLEEVNRAIDAGAVTGPISQYLPTITKATASLEAAANSLGIDIINSATFGALSETELRLALSTGLPQGLPEAELQKWVKSKIAAQKKLRDELFRQAQTLLSGGVRYTEWASNFAKQALEKSAQEQAATPAAPTAPTAAPQSEEELFKTVEIQ